MIEGHGDDLYRYGGRITMNFSSNIYPGADLSGLKAHLVSRLDAIGAYPEPRPFTLERMIAGRCGIPADCVMVTSGATEAIYLIAQAFAAADGMAARYAVRRPAFSEYDDACRMFGYAEVPFDDADADSGGAVLPPCGGGVLRWLCHPCNPTGEALTPDYIQDISRRGGITVVDQSYEDYTLAPVLSAAGALRHENVILLHSMTKTYAVPGLRLGYVTARREIVMRLRQYARPWSVNALAAEAGLYLVARGQPAVPDLHGYLAAAADLRRALDGVPGISVQPTATNFMLARMAAGTAAELKEYLAMRHGMLIRDCSNFRGLSTGHFRVAARSVGDNRLLVGAVNEYMERRMNKTV